MALMARVKILGAAARFSDAHDLLRQAETDYPAATLPLDQFNRMLATSVLVHQAILATSWLLERFSASYGLTLGIEVSDAHPSAVTLQAEGNDARFLFTRSLFEWPACELIISRWAAIYPLVDAFMRSPHRTDGR